MLNKRKNILNAAKINRYNNFLTTLDKGKFNFVISPNIIIDNSECNDKKADKPEIDNIIDRINNNFDANKYFASNFTGQTKQDFDLFNTNINNPDSYDDFLSAFKKSRPKTLFTKQPPIKINPLSPYVFQQPIKKETITIECEINTIDDILNLINTHKLEPNIQYNINMKALHEIKPHLEELHNMIGMNELKTNIVEQILYFIQGLHSNSVDFMHTVIYGPPGTGKTEIAKIMGKIYSKIGLLEKGTFKKVTRSDLIAGFLGQTALKTKDVINEAIGGVLFIDEAYALGNLEKRDSFSKECIDTLCESLSDHKENLMVIIAGYEKELKECFFNSNQGLESRFTWRFKTDDYTHDDLYHIFVKKVKEIGWVLENEINSEWFKKNKDYFKFYGRDIETILAKTKIAHSKRVFCMPESEKKKINIKDLNKGFEVFIKNNDIQSKLDDEYKRKQLYNSLYC
jgi:Holliday junction resolvasome RuvABC ATP-dependent DNA helicase subunit